MKLNVVGDVPLLSPRDLNFLLYEWLDISTLCDRARFAQHSSETFDAVLDLAADIAAQLFSPANKLGDQHDITASSDGSFDIVPEARKALAVVAESGMLGCDFDEQLGGMQLPQVVTRAANAWLLAANVAITGYIGLTVGNAHLLAHYGTAEQIDTWVRPMVEGRYFGTMCLSEPESGSSLADIATRAVPDDGTYRITGSKMWISGGDHDLTENIVHLVLAKVPGAPAGVRGISLFIVPKFIPFTDGSTRNDVALVGLNHKMGQRGSTNALLNFGGGTFEPEGRPGAIGYLVGEENDGLAQMFHMMNEVRIAVGTGAAAVGYTGYLQSLAYARTRVQGRSLAARDGTGPQEQVPIITHPDVRRMLLAQKSYAEGGLALALYASRLVDDMDTADDDALREQRRLLLEVLTPIVKSWPSQWGLAANDLAIQVHGGSGYTRDFNVEQLFRDNRLNAIHEGTHGIQGLDLLGRKVMMQGGAGLRLLLETMGQTATRATDTMDEDLARWAAALQQSLTRVADTTARLWETGDPATALANSSVYLEAVGHVVVAWIWLEQALAAHGKLGDFYDGKRAAAHYFYAYELPKTAPQFDLLGSLDRSLVDLNESCL